MMQKAIVIAAWCGQIPCGGMGPGCRFPSEGGKAQNFFYLIIVFKAINGIQ